MEIYYFRNVRNKTGLQSKEALFIRGLQTSFTKWQLQHLKINKLILRIYICNCKTSTRASHRIMQIQTSFANQHHVIITAIKTHTQTNKQLEKFWEKNRGKRWAKPIAGDKCDTHLQTTRSHKFPGVDQHTLVVDALENFGNFTCICLRVVKCNLSKWKKLMFASPS